MYAVANPHQPHPRYISTNPILVAGGKYCLGIEHIGDIADEVQILHEEHWQETETLYLKEQTDALRPDYARAAACLDQGQCTIFTARVAATQELIGNMVFFIMRSFHDKDRVSANEDVFFISKPHRGRLAVHLLDYAEQTLTGFGVKSVGVTDKAPCGGPDLQRFLERRGYQMVARYFRKPL